MKTTIIKDVVPTPNPGRPYPGRCWGWGMLLLYTYWFVMIGMTLHGYRNTKAPEFNKVNLVCYK